MYNLDLPEIEIESIEEISYNEDVYLLEVENDHNYFVENILSKNCQNMTLNQIKMCMTRIGDNSKIIVCGDIEQVDLRKKSDSGLSKIINFELDNYIVYELTTEHRKKIVRDLLEEFRKIE